MADLQIEITVFGRQFECAMIGSEPAFHISAFFEAMAVLNPYRPIMGYLSQVGRVMRCCFLPALVITRLIGNSAKLPGICHRVYQGRL